MSYAIIGFGKIGQALAHAFARNNIDVTVASRRPPEELAPRARAIGPTVVAKSLQEALKADTIFLAVLEGGHRVVFLSSDDEDAVAPAADLAKQLGFAPVKLGKLNEGGWLVHARGRTWGQLIFQDVFKKQQ
ncbi:NAD(P)-binding domain-containing protein [Terriglobus sp. YAF25]|uniref:NAD(P)-binding domain-containing protein n=1 Tax=Terriglobus sp. YAF25 TaxID=3233080 RepID=UPI003F9E722D